MPEGNLLSVTISAIMWGKEVIFLVHSTNRKMRGLQEFRSDNLMWGFERPKLSLDAFIHCEVLKELVSTKFYMHWN